MMNNYYGVTIGVKCKDTVKIAKNNIVINTTDRDNTWLIQTPQCFDKNILLECHKKHINSKNITDDSMLLEKEGYSVLIIEGDYINIKITTQSDTLFVKELLK